MMIPVILQGSYCNEVEKNIKFYEAARDDFLAVENWEPYGDRELDNIDVLDIHKIPCKFSCFKMFPENVTYYLLT